VKWRMIPIYIDNPVAATQKVTEGVSAGKKLVTGWEFLDPALSAVSPDAELELVPGQKLKKLFEKFYNTTYQNAQLGSSGWAFFHRSHFLDFGSQSPDLFKQGLVIKSLAGQSIQGQAGHRGHQQAE